MPGNGNFFLNSQTKKPQNVETRNQGLFLPEKLSFPQATVMFTFAIVSETELKIVVQHLKFILQDRSLSAMTAMGLLQCLHYV